MDNGQATLALRAELYHLLAEVLSPPPRWLARAGTEWPLHEMVRQLRSTSAAAQRATVALAGIQPEPAPARQARYEAIFMGPGRPRFWLYASMAINGRLLGPETQALATLYQAAGLELVGSELPDHASMELAFLAYLAKMQANEPEKARDWQKLERNFIKKHAGRWLPELGRALARSGDEVYAPIGKLLVGWLEESLNPPRNGRTAVRLPVIRVEEDCTLCGFCLQVCPTKALAVYETERETSLLLSPAACTGCRQCEHICDPCAIQMEPVEGKLQETPIVLRRSPRATCAACGQPMVSQAELAYVAAQLEQPTWLSYCLECRSLLMMENVL